MHPKFSIPPYPNADLPSPYGENAHDVGILMDLVRGSTQSYNRLSMDSLEHELMTASSLYAAYLLSLVLHFYREIAFSIFSGGNKHTRNSSSSILYFNTI